MPTTSVFAPLGNLKRIGEKGVKINIKDILELSKKEYVFKKEAGKAITERLPFLKGKTRVQAKNLLKKLYGEDKSC